MKTILIGCRDRGGSWSGNDHRIVVKSETPTEFIG